MILSKYQKMAKKWSEKLAVENVFSHLFIVVGIEIRNKDNNHFTSFITS